MWEGIRQSKSKTLLAFCFSFLLGVLAISILDIRFDFVYIYIALFVAASFLIIAWQNKSVRFIVICLLLFVIGLGRYLIVFPQGEIKIGKTEFTGYIAAEPDIRADGVRYIIKSDYGRIYLKEKLYPRYHYGDVLQVNCELVKPEPIEDFRYDMYLARYGVFSICTSAKINKIGEGEGSLVLRGIFSLKEVVAVQINKLWHEPHASFMAGLLYGYRGGLGELNELFNRTGVTHIVAISGYNITIVVTILLAITVSLYIPRKKAFWLVIIGIALFVLFAGASASVLRAGIMGIIVLLAKQVGRLSRVGNIMALTAVLMAIQNPLVLVWDAGFQLSFIATLGLVYLTPLIRGGFERWPQFLGIRESVISTLAAIIATLPLILYQFGRLSIVAPVVNVLILWLIPMIMLFGFLTILLSFLWLSLGEVLAWITWVGLKYITTVVKWFASLDFAAVAFFLPAWVMIILYVGLVYWIIKYTKKV